mgnify:CR=1 FL=1
MTRHEMAAYWLAQAQWWERLATEDDARGDESQAARARRNARRCRRWAESEVGYPERSGGVGRSTQRLSYSVAASW